MVDENSYNKLLQESLKQELRFLNAQLPGRQKSLKALLNEETPSVKCADGSLQLIKRREIDYISTLIDESDWEKLLLPMVIEINPGKQEMLVVTHGEVEEKLVSGVIGMPVVMKRDRVVIHKAQLAALRKVLKTTTQYMFSPNILK